MKKRLQALLIIFVMLLGLLPAGAFAQNSINVFVSISQYGGFVTAKDGSFMAAKKIELSGKESYTIDDVLKTTHELYCSDGGAGYATEENEYYGGLSIKTLWGDNSGNFGYYTNGNMAWALSGAVSDGDYVEAFIYTPSYEGYSKFDSFSKTPDENGILNLSLTYVSGYGDETTNYAPIVEPCEDAEITVDNIKTGIKTNSNGSASITLAPGNHFVSAIKTKETNGTVSTVITAPVCTASYKGLFYIRDSLGDELPADGYSYFIGDTGKTLSVKSDGEAATAYEWRFKTSLDAATSSLAGKSSEARSESFTLPATQDGIRYYYCKVTHKKDGRNAYYETQTIKVSVTARSAETPTVSSPTSAEYMQNSGSVAPLSVKATVSDGGKLSYQWLKKSDNDTEFSEISGAVEANYTPSVENVGTTSYKCSVTNTVNSISGETYSSSNDSAEATITVKSFSELGITWTGSGTKTTPYSLGSSEDLKKLSELVAGGETFKDKYFVFASDLTLPENWTPIGSLKEGVVFDPLTTRAESANLFSGNIDGKNHLLTVPKGSLSLLGACSGATLSNLSIFGEEIAGYGVCEYYMQGTGNIEINNVTLKSGTKTLKSGFIGGFASGMDYVAIKNCTVEKNVVIGYNNDQNNIGSFGGDFNGLIENCKSSADVFGIDFVGGISGSKGQSMGKYIIRECEFSGNVTASGNYAGGISGHGYVGTRWGFSPNAQWATIQNCISTGNIKAANYAGGILGAEAGVVQNWENSVSYIQNNFFGGTVQILETGENAYVGGIIGYIKSVDRYNVISGNLYTEDCGAMQGIGCLAAVDNSAKYGITDIEAGSDPQEFSQKVSNDYNLVAEKLNSSLNSCGTWKVENGKLTIGNEKHITEIETDPVLAVKNGLKITTGNEFDNYKIVVHYSNGTTENVSLNLAKKVNCDFSVAGNRRAEIIYNNHQYVFMLNVPTALIVGSEEGGSEVSGSSSSNSITVKFTLMGDDKHGEDGNVHTLRNGGLKTWISKTSVSIPKNSTVMDVFAKILSKEGYSWVNENKKGGTSGNYIQSITTPNGTKLAEFSNGKNSGWMCAFNGKHTLLGINEQVLADGDEIVFHYSDDYAAEEDSNKWHGSSSSKKDTTTSTDKKDEKTEDSKTDEVSQNKKPSFKDVQKYSWYKEAVDFTVEKGLFSGTSEETFEPEALLTRAMFVTLIHRMEGEPKAEKGGFSDVEENGWYALAADWAKFAGITSGTSEETFDPELNITREQLATMLFRYAQYKNFKTENGEISAEKFSDLSDVSQYSKDAVVWAVSVGILNGIPEGTLNPTATATRAETAVMLMRFCKLFEI